jgi:hypothetical protein
MKMSKLTKGYKRNWYKCKEKDCKEVFYRDYVPFSFSKPVIWTTCGHSIGHRDYNMVRITAKRAKKILKTNKKEII